MDGCVRDADDAFTVLLGQQEAKKEAITLLSLSTRSRQSEKRGSDILNRQQVLLFVFEDNIPHTTATTTTSTSALAKMPMVNSAVFREDFQLAPAPKKWR